MNIIEDFTFETKFNQTRHDFEIYLDNGAGESDQRRYPISPNTIVNLTIEDTLADWVVRGHMTFFYNPEAAIGIYDERLGQISNSTGILTPEQKGFYVFRNDGNDLLRIRINPVLDGSSSNLDVFNLTDGLRITDDRHWTLSYLFSIYDIEDIDLPPGARNQASATVKALKIYFWDSWYQRMLSNRLQYSTGLSIFSNAKADIQQGKYANPGTLSTGQAMKEIIDLSLSQDSSQEKYTGTFITPAPSLNFSYNPTPPIGPEWDPGATNIFFTAPAGHNAYESLMYVYDKHVSSSKLGKPPTASAPRGGTVSQNDLYDFSILVKERGPKATDLGQLTLKSMSSYFQNAGNRENVPGPYQIEHYFLQSYGSSYTSKINDPDVPNNQERATKSLRAPISNEPNDVVDLKTLKYNQITTYRFVDISALTNTTKFCNSPVYSFDFKNRVFNVEFKNNSVLAAREFMSQKYINELYRKNTDNEKLFLITLDQDKKNKNVQPSFSCYGDDPIIRQSSGLQKLLYVGVFQNACVNFRTLGLTNREPGRFIAIDKTEGVESGPFEDKFFGQWFIINVKHVFETEFYYNDITAIKIHRFDSLPLNFVGTIDN
jgi:hypothetical protein